MVVYCRLQKLVCNIWPAVILYIFWLKIKGNQWGKKLTSNLHRHSSVKGYFFLSSLETSNLGTHVTATSTNASFGHRGDGGMWCRRIRKMTAWRNPNPTLKSCWLFFQWRRTNQTYLAQKNQKKNIRRGLDAGRHTSPQTTSHDGVYFLMFFSMWMFIGCLSHSSLAGI